MTELFKYESTIKSFYKDKRVFITGGAGFIGSRLLDYLLNCGAQVTVGDNLSTGNINNLERVWKSNGVSFNKTKIGYNTSNGGRFIFVDFQNLTDCIESIRSSEIVFHLAATIGGRGYIDTHPADCCENFSINQNVIKACHAASVNRVIFASSACVYPVSLQSKYGSKYKLKEHDADLDSWLFSDRSYGWSKIMGEMSLRSYYEQYGLKGCSVRYVTAYGPWENDSHAIIMLCKKALRKDDPYTVWGSGNQDRDFTYVDDIVEGTLLSGIHITDGSAVNIGTGKRYKIKDVLQIIFKLTNWKPKRIIFDKSRPEGVKSRALDVSLVNRSLNWKPRFMVEDGLFNTIEWIKNEVKSINEK